MPFVSSCAPPDEGYLWCRLLPPGGRELDVVMIAPGVGPSRRQRRLIETRQMLSFHVRGEVPFWRTPLPCDFDDITVKWMARLADFISIWSEPGTDQAGNIYEHLKDRTRPRWLTVETTPSAAPDWLHFVNRWKRPGVDVVEFGPLHGEGGA